MSNINGELLINCHRLPSGAERLDLWHSILKCISEKNMFVELIKKIWSVNVLSDVF